MARLGVEPVENDTPAAEPERSIGGPPRGWFAKIAGALRFRTAEEIGASPILTREEREAAEWLREKYHTSWVRLASPSAIRGTPVPAHGGAVRLGNKYASPRIHYFPSLGPQGFHRIAYTEWGNPSNPNIVLCVHGLTRNSRDFDALAASLARDFRVVCMDVAGRGASDWLQDKRDYGFSLYQSDAAALLARVTAPTIATSSAPTSSQPKIPGIRQVDWVGTSMGGLIGMMLAAKANSPIRRLVMNDVGPFIPWYVLLSIGMRDTGHHLRFDGLPQVEQYLRESCAAFGPLQDHQWRNLAEHNARPHEDGGYSLAFDPAILAPRRDPTIEYRLGSDFRQGVNLWPVWDKVQCPTLVLRGGESDVLDEVVAAEMQQRNPGTRLVEFPGIGHAPWLASDHQIQVVRDFLLGTHTS